MAVDAKELVQRNKILIVCYVIALIPVILWFVFVGGGVKDGVSRSKNIEERSFTQVKNELNQKKNALNKLVADIDKMRRGATDNPVYTPQHITAFKTRNTALDSQYKDMIDLIVSRDKPLERWFDRYKEYETKTGPNDVPPPGNFDSTLKEEIAKLTDSYKDLVFNPLDQTKTCLLWQETVGNGNQRVLMKRYWVQESLISALKHGGAINLLEAITFAQPPLIPSGPNDKKPLIVPITIHSCFLASFRDVPRIMHEVLAQDIVFRVTKLHCELEKFGYSRGEPDGFAPGTRFQVNTDPKPVFEQAIYTGVLVDKTKYSWEQEDKVFLPEPKIRVTLDVEALDFDTDQLAPPAAPVAPGAPGAPAPPGNP
jgi:hypothetical protein